MALVPDLSVVRDFFLKDLGRDIKERILLPIEGLLLEPLEPEIVQVFNVVVGLGRVVHQLLGHAANVHLWEKITAEVKGSFKTFVELSLGLCCTAFVKSFASALDRFFRNCSGTKQ